MIWIIILLVWVLCMPIVYQKVTSKWDNTMFEKIWFAVLWPMTGICYLAFLIHHSL